MSTVNRMTDSSGSMSSRYTFGFGTIATSNTKSPSDSLRRPCGSSGTDHATAPGPRLTRRFPKTIVRISFPPGGAGPA